MVKQTTHQVETITTIFITNDTHVSLIKMDNQTNKQTNTSSKNYYNYFITIRQQPKSKQMDKQTNNTIK
jgi:hypothetical protein